MSKKGNLKKSKQKIAVAILTTTSLVIFGIYRGMEVFSVLLPAVNDIPKIPPNITYTITGIAILAILAVYVSNKKFKFLKRDDDTKAYAVLVSLIVISWIPFMLRALSGFNTEPLKIDPYMGIYPDSKVSTAPVPTNQTPDSKLLSEITNPENMLTSNLNLSDEEIVLAVIQTEVKAASERNLLILESIFTPNAIVMNRNKTPYNSSDDLIYTGWDNIRQLHYINLFRSQTWQPPSYLVDLQIEISNDKATGTHRGLVSNNTYFEDYSIYTLERIDGKWLIIQLEYGNLDVSNK